MSSFDLDGGVLGRLLDPDMLLEAGVVSAGAGLGSLAFSALVDLVRVNPEGTAEETTVPFLSTPLRRLGGAVGVGLVGGWGAWALNDDLGKGFVGAMMGAAGRELYNVVTGQADVKIQRGEDQDAASFKQTVEQAQLRGLSRGLAGAIGRLGDASILMQQAGGRGEGAFAQLADASVEDADDFSPPVEDFSLGTVSSIVAA